MWYPGFPRSSSVGKEIVSEVLLFNKFMLVLNFKEIEGETNSQFILLCPNENNDSHSGGLTLSLISAVLALFPLGWVRLRLVSHIPQSSARWFVAFSFDNHRKIYRDLFRT